MDDQLKNILLKTVSSIIVGLALGYAYNLYFTQPKAQTVLPQEKQKQDQKKDLENLKQYEAQQQKEKQLVRIYMDGCFDLTHVGHANAIRQAKNLGDVLVVGVVADDQILKHKGPPILSLQERVTMIDSIKWVDEVIEGVPYDINPQFMKLLFEKYRIDYIVHGDDPCVLADGSDAYQYAKELGKFKMFKRTDGVSTSDIVNRLIQIQAKEQAVDVQIEDDSSQQIVSDQTKASSKVKSWSTSSDREVTAAINQWPQQNNPQTKSLKSRNSISSRGPPTNSSFKQPPSLRGPARKSSDTTSNTIQQEAYTQPQNPISQVQEQDPMFFKFLPTSHKIVQFSNQTSPPKGAKVVYVDGAFDLFHCGHVDLLKNAKNQGDYLLVGIYSNYDVQKRNVRSDYPVMDLYERTLSVLACKYVDEVIIGAPTFISIDLIRNFNISIVFRGDVSQSSKSDKDIQERYIVPIKQGKLRRYQSSQTMNLKVIMERISQHKDLYNQNSQAKMQKELQLLQTRSSSMKEI